MTLQNFGYLIESGKKAGESRLLFDITLLDQRFKCLFLIEMFKFIIVAQSKSKGTIAHFNAQGEQVGSTYLPPEFYYAIYPTICQLDNGNKKAKPDVFWKSFDEKILNAKITRTNDAESYDMLRTTSTADKQLEDGYQPFFLTFARNIVISVTTENLKKTEYCLGRKYREMCEKNNISTRWTNDVTKAKVGCFFNPILLEKEFNDTLSKH